MSASSSLNSIHNEYLCNMDFKAMIRRIKGRNSPASYGAIGAGLSVFALRNTLSANDIPKRYNMLYDNEKFAAMSVCTPLATVIGRMGDMLSGAAVYVTDRNGNERRKYSDIRKLLEHPNPMQTCASFLKSVEISLKLYGYCPIYTLRGIFSDAPPAAMYVIPVPLFHMTSTGKLFRQTDIEGIVDEAYIDWGAFREPLGKEDYFVVYDSSFRIEGRYSDIVFDSQTDGLSLPVNGWVSAMTASCRMVTNGGPKGIVYYDSPTDMGNTMDPKDKNYLERKLSEKYGMLNGLPIAASPVKVGWIPLDYNADQMKLAELDERCARAVCGAYGLNYSLFNDAKYDNQESAKKAAYQDVIIPDARKIAEALTRAVCPDDAEIRLDFSHVECLSADIQKKAQSISTTASALSSLLSAGMISVVEARTYLAGLMDIDPNDIPEGNSNKDKGNEQDEEQV